MIKADNSKILTSQQSVRYHPNLALDRELDDATANAHYDHMFIEDIGYGFMPLRYFHSNKVTLSLTPYVQVMERLLGQALDLSGHDVNLMSAAPEFFRYCAQDMVVYGEAVFEIAYKMEEETGRVVGFQFVRIHPKTMSYWWGRPTQQISTELAAKLKCSSKIRLPRADIVRFRWSALRRHQVRTMMRELLRVGRERFAALGGASLEELHQKYGFDFPAHMNYIDWELGRACHDIGWNVRETFKEHVSEYYRISQHLVFTRFKIELRDYMLQTLNTALLRVAKVANFSGQLQLEGATTLEDVTKAEVDLVAGRRSFLDFVQIIR